MVKESSSRANSLMPTSLAKIIPVSNTFASASINPNRAWIFLLKPTIKFPSWSRIKTPTPVAIRAS